MTPTLIEIQERHKAFHAKIAARARPDPGVSCPSALAKHQQEERKDDETVDLLQEWVDRQKEIPLPVAPKEPWFSIIAEIDPPPRTLSIRDIQRACAAEYGVQVGDLWSARRDHKVMKPRQVAMYLAKDMTAASLPVIGLKFGNRDHTTAMHNIQKITRLLQTDSELVERVERIRATLNGALNDRHIHHLEAPSAPLPASPDRPSASPCESRAAALDPQG